MARLTVFLDAPRRRDWSDGERLEILRGAFASGAIVDRVAWLYDILRGLIYIWRRGAMTRAQSAFAPTVIEDAPALEPPCRPGAEPIAAIVLELPDGGRLRILALAPSAVAAAALRTVQ